MAGERNETTMSKGKNTQQQRHSGEIAIEGTSNGRLVTLDPIREKHLSIPVRQVESTLPCGFQQHWAHVDADGTECDIACGAGVGSKWMTVTIGDRRYCMSVEDIFVAVMQFDTERPQ